MTDRAMDKKPSFEYTYSPKQQKEIEDIRKKYLPKEEDKMETLRKLDKGAEKPGTIVALALGIAGVLLLGIVILSVAYPVYKIITKKQREKIAEQILALSDELSL